MKILVADDVQSNRDVLKFILTQYGDVFLAENGEEALAAFKLHLDNGQPFDLVLMDIMMPKMDGQICVQKIRRLEKIAYGDTVSSDQYSVIIMQTCLEEPQSLVDAYLKGKVNSYILKPVDSNKLVELMKKHKLI